MSLITDTLGRGIRRVGGQTIASLVLLLAALSCMVYGLAEVTRGLESSQMLILVTLGMFIGWWIGRTGLSGWFSTILVWFTGTGGLVIYLGRLEKPLLILIVRLVDLYFRVWEWAIYRGSFIVDIKPTLQALIDVWNRLSLLYDHVLDWVRTWYSGGIPFDPLFNFLLWGLILWGVAAWAGWQVRRRQQVWLGLAPSGAVLIATLNFVHGNTGILVPFLGLVMLLAVLTGHHSREKQWDDEQIDYSTDIRGDLTVVSILLVGGILLLAMLIPSFSVKRIVELARKLSERQPAQVENIGESLGLEPPAGEEGFFGGIAQAVLPRSHLIGSGPELSNQIVMTISTGELPAGPPENIPASSISRYYWRSVTYDQYIGRGWKTGEITYSSYEGGELARNLDYLVGMPTHRLVRQEIRLEQNLGGQIFTAGTLIAADLPYQVAWRVNPNLPNPSGDVVENFASQDMFLARFTDRAGAGIVYRAQSLVPAVSQAQLHAAPSTYPVWLTERYLSLPNSVTSRTSALASEITQGITNPYDRALAIENYLRNIPYSVDVTAPPDDRDVVDYFLFDLKKGYCDYYASAMVVMARLSGLPARLVTGYATGAYNSYHANYVVTAADAHTWVEIYFPDIGWVEFEPTASRPPIQRPEQLPSTEMFTLKDVPTLPAQNDRGALTWLVLATGAIFITGLSLSVWYLYDTLRLLSLSPASVIDHLFRRMRSRGERLLHGRSIFIKKGNTPFEFAGQFSTHWAIFEKYRPLNTLLAPSAHEVTQLTELYTEATYSQHVPDKEDKTRAILSWRNIRLRFFLARLFRKRSI
jgi:hypothetical protein